jgi:Glycosyl transferase family 2/Carbohydrate binding domain/Leucine-rich repeats of kinetochore protein Cenp-F/LEK1
VNVTVIMPAYNAATTIAEAIESVLAQTSPDWELIVVNDGSSDATLEVATAFAARDSRIRVISQPNGGESAARNTGLAEARYDWIVFLDADDWILPAYVERMTLELANQPSLDAVHCGCARIAQDGTQVVDGYRPPMGDLFPTLARRAAFPVHSCMVRKSLVNQVGWFDTTLRKSPDWDLWQRIARAGANFGSVPEILAHYRMGSNSASLEAEQMLYDGLKVLKRGHLSDPRVSNPRPEYVNGLSGSTVQSQEFYLLSWSAGLLLGTGRDARHLLQAVGDDSYPALYANAIAQCLFEAATLPLCRSREAWEELWPQVKDLAEEFLVALEAQSQAPHLARASFVELKKLVLKSSLTWGPVIEQEEQSAAELRATIERFVEGSALTEAARDRWRQRTEIAEAEFSEARRSAEALASEVRDLGGQLAALREEKARLESDLAESRGRIGELESEKASLDSLLAEARRRIGALDLAALESERQILESERQILESKRHIEETERQKAELIRDLADARGQIVQLTGEKEAVERDRAYFSQELEKWRLSADERSVLIEEMQQENWVRAGQALRLLKRREIAPASLELSPRPNSSDPHAPGGGELAAPNWEFRVAPGSEAHLIYPRQDAEMVRIGITKATRTKWDIQINRPGLKVTSGQRYEVAFRARARKSREITVGFAQAYDPWLTLGLYKTLRLNQEWQTFREEFVAPADDDNARIHFDLGGRAIGVDLTSVVLQRVADVSSAEPKGQSA